MRRCVVIMLLLGSTWTTSGLASHGGPETVQILGYDPIDQKIFYTTNYQDESDLWPDVHYFDLKGARPWIPVRVDMRKGLGTSAGEGDWRSPEYTELSDRMMRLRQRLRPLAHAMALNVSVQAEVLSADSVTVMGEWKVARLRRSVELRDSTHSARVEVTTYCGQRLGIESVLRIPGQAWTLVVLSSEGIPVETCYALESPVLLFPAGSPTRKLVSSRPGGPLGLPKP